MPGWRNGSRDGLKIHCSKGRVGSIPTPGTMNNRRLNSNKELQAYIIGIALGDGNLSNVRKTTRLRISCDAQYPLLLNKIYTSLQLLLPDNKVNVRKQQTNCSDVYVYSNLLENFLGWKAKGGSKFLQKVSVPNWIKQNTSYKINCLRGLIETDGSVYVDRGYKMVIFKSIIPNLTQDFYNMMVSLGFAPHFYTLRPNKTVKYQYNQQTAYQVRLSKNVSGFLELVKPEKI